MIKCCCIVVNGVLWVITIDKESVTAKLNKMVEWQAIFCHTRITQTIILYQHYNISRQWSIQVPRNFEKYPQNIISEHI